LTYAAGVMRRRLGLIEKLAKTLDYSFIRPSPMRFEKGRPKRLWESKSFPP
jgi:hypothetical protein